MSEVDKMKRVKLKSGCQYGEMRIQNGPLETVITKDWTEVHERFPEDAYSELEFDTKQAEEPTPVVESVEEPKEEPVAEPEPVEEPKVEAKPKKVKKKKKRR